MNVLSFIYASFNFFKFFSLCPALGPKTNTDDAKKKTKQKEKRRQRVREKPTPPSNPEFIVGMNNAFQCVHKRNLWELICFT